MTKLSDYLSLLTMMLAVFFFLNSSFCNWVSLADESSSFDSLGEIIGHLMVSRSMVNNWTTILLVHLVGLIYKSLWAERFPFCQHLCHLIIIYIEMRSLYCCLNFVGRGQRYYRNKVVFLLSFLHKSYILPFTQIGIIYDYNLSSALCFFAEVWEHFFVYVV